MQSSLNAENATAPDRPTPQLLRGQKALVTGANSGIGKAVAVALGQAGSDVVVNYVTGPQAAEEVVQEIRSAGRTAYAHQADVSQEQQVEDMFQQMIQKLGRIDILVNNAGLQRDAPFHEMTLDQWHTVINVNLTGQFLCAREAVRHFIKTGVVKGVSCSAGDHLHELSAPRNSLGRPRQLCGFEGRHQDADAKHGTRACAASDSRQRHSAGSNSDAN